MKINDIITMAKAGYTPTEIKNTENRDNIITMLNAGIKKDEIPEYMELYSQQEEQQEEQQENNSKDGETDDIDYKSLYEDLLKKQQKDNAHKDMSGHIEDDKETDIERIKKIIKEIK